MTLQLIRRQAERLARENRESDPSIRQVYWLPDEKEVRLVELHPGVPATGDGPANAFYFRPDPADDLSAPSGVVLIRPEEFRRVLLPPG